MSQKAINFYKSKALKRILAQWLVAIKEYTSNNSQVTKIVSQINKRITNESFQFWLGLIVPKIFKMRSVQRIEYVLSVKKTVLSFKKWACEAKKLTASANFNKFLVRISDKIIIKRTLKA